MNSYIEISTVQLNQDREEMQRQMQLIIQKLDQLSDEINALNGMWSGPANSSYNQQTGIDFSKLGDLMKKLGGFVQCMEYAVQEYVKCEDSVADAVASIWI